ncbi:hypothetical protein P8452_70577 [Trifolium repens]|nr:hypothetical protein P8452_70577 [Trifolium repens]
MLSQKKFPNHFSIFPNRFSLSRTLNQIFTYSPSQHRFSHVLCLRINHLVLFPMSHDFVLHISRAVLATRIGNHP